MSLKVDRLADEVFSADNAPTNIKFYYTEGATAENLAEYLSRVRAEERNGLIETVDVHAEGY